MPRPGGLRCHHLLQSSALAGSHSWTAGALGDMLGGRASWGRQSEPWGVTMGSGCPRGTFRPRGGLRGLLSLGPPALSPPDPAQNPRAPHPPVCIWADKAHFLPALQPPGGRFGGKKSWGGGDAGAGDRVACSGVLLAFRGLGRARAPVRRGGAPEEGSTEHGHPHQEGTVPGTAGQKHFHQRLAACSAPERSIGSQRTCLV